MVTGLIECYNSADGQKTIEQIKIAIDRKDGHSANFKSKSESSAASNPYKGITLIYQRPVGNEKFYYPLLPFRIITLRSLI